MTLPDHEFDPDDNFRHAFDDEDDMDLDDTEALVWNLLVLINPGDEETALRRDDDGMQQLAAVMGVEIRPGSDAF